MSSSPISRRDWIKAAGAAALGAGIAPTCGGGASGGQHPKVQVSPDRIIRSVAGLRPFRPSGFRVEMDSLDKKTVIHNYGHGGGGMTLSWGTSHLAVEKALETRERAYAVMGCGAVGLAAARLLQRHGFAVTIYAKDLPPRTTSNIACATWYPAEGVDPGKRTPEWTDQFVRAARLSYRYFQDLVGDYYGIRWLPSYVLSEQLLDEGGPSGLDGLVEDLMPDLTYLEAGEHPG